MLSYKLTQDLYRNFKMVLWPRPNLFNPAANRNILCPSIEIYIGTSKVKEKGHFTLLCCNLPLHAKDVC